MTITRIQGNSVNSAVATTSQAVTLLSGIAKGNLLVCSVASGSNVTTISGPDASWHQVAINQPAGASATIETSIWYLVVDASHAGQTSWTFTFSASHTVFLCIEEWNTTASWLTSPVDVTALGDTIATPVTSTTISSGATTTTVQAEELWIAALAYKGSAQSESSITSGWTKDLEATLTGNNTLTMLYKVASATGAASCSYVIGTGQFWAGCVATFRDTTNITTTITERLTSFSAQGSASSAGGFTTTITERLTSFSATATTTAFTSITTTITERLTSFSATASTSGSQSQIAQLASFSALAGVTSSIPLPSTPGVSVLIGNNPAQHVMVKEGSFEIDDSINQVSTCSFTVRDDSGLSHFEKGQAVLVNDHVNGIMFTGVVNTSEEDNVRPNPLTNSTIDCQDNHWFPAKRLYKGPEFVEQYAGVIATELLNVLSAEGITAQYASRRETTQTQLGLGALTNVVAANNVGDGDLELALAGGSAGSNFGNLTMFTTSALKFEATAAVSGGGNLYHYRKIWAGSQTLVNGDTLAYDLWISSTSPTAQFGVDFLFSDGTTLRGAAVPGTDNQGIGPSPVIDRVGLAVDTWYSTGSGLSGTLAGKTIVGVTLGVEGDTLGTYTAYFRHIKLHLHVGGTVTFFDTTLQQNPSVQVQNSGYYNAIVSVVDAGDPTVTFGIGPFDLSAAVIYQNSIFNYVPVTPAKSTALIQSSIDGQATWQTITAHDTIPSLVAGMSLTGKSLYFRTIFAINGPDPTQLPMVTSRGFTVNPSYNGTKADVIDSDTTTSDFSAGTLTNTVAGNNDLTLDGAYRTYDNADASNQTNYSTIGNYKVINRQLQFGSISTGDIRVRLDWIGQRQNGTFETNVQVPANGNVGIVYRTPSANWQNNNNTYAYCANISLTAVNLDRGTNSASGSGTKTNISTVAITLTAGDWHRVKVVVSGSSHTVYLDDVSYISVIDATYSASGYCALRYENTTATVTFAYFDSAGYCAALTGTRVSPSLSLTSAATYGDSRIWWDSTELETTAILVETSIDNSNTYQTAQNGGSIPGLTAGQPLAGVSVLVRQTLTASNATLQPALHGITALVVGQLSASGTRIGPSLSLLNVGRLGGSVVAWNSVLGTGATLGVDTSIDGGGTWQDVTSQNGGSIPGLTGQPEPTIDGFDTNTSASYSNVSLSGVLYSLRTFGGPVPLSAAWAYDTANSRIIASGAGRALYIYNPLTEVSDVDLLMYSEHSDAGGLTWRYTDAANHYELVVQDDSSSEGTPNSAAVYKVASGTRTLLLARSVRFPRGTPHISRVTMIASVITVYFDGLQVLTVTDGSPLSAGKCGLFTGGGVAHFYQLRIQPLGQDVTALSVMTRWRLATTNPLATPQVLDTSLAAYGNTIAQGALIPQTNYNLDYVSNNFDDLVKQSSSATGNQWWWSLDRNKVFSMLPQTGILAPWVGSSAGTGDFLNAGLKVTKQSDLYRNRQIIKNVLDTVAVDESRVGDGTSTSWTFGNQWAAAPTITVDGVSATVGVKNVDTGRQFYYVIGDPTITEDSSGPLYVSVQVIRFVGTGQFTTYSQYDDLNEQAAFQLVEGGSGIVENVEDGAGITKVAGDQLAKARVMQYGVRGRILTATTRRYGLAPGQLFPVFLPEHGVNDGLFLIRNVKTRLTTEYDPTQGAMIQHGWHTIEAVEGADIGDWTRLFLRPQ